MTKVKLRTYAVYATGAVVAVLILVGQPYIAAAAGVTGLAATFTLIRD